MGSILSEYVSESVPLILYQLRVLVKLIGDNVYSLNQA